MFGNLLPFLMFGILLAAVLSKPLARLPWISLPVALVLAGFVSSEIWVGFGMDTGLRWQILRDLVFYLLLPILIFEAAINVDTRWLRREAVLIGMLSVPLLLVAAWLAAGIIKFLMGASLGGSWALALSLSIEIPHWYTVQSAVYGVALFSLVVQTPLLPYLALESGGRRELIRDFRG